jgi:hypothetical protein
MVFPERVANGTTRYVSPTAYNGRTAAGAEGLDGHFEREGALQMFLAPGVRGLPWAWGALHHAGFPWGAAGIDGWIQMACEVLWDPVDNHLDANIHNLASQGLPATTTWTTPPRFGEPWPGVTPVGARVHFAPNLPFLRRDATWFDAWDQAVANGQDFLPFETPTPHFWSAPADWTPAPGSGAFFYARPSVLNRALAALVHAGPVGPNVYQETGFPDLVEGYGGGQLAALWSPRGGPFVLARRRGRNNPPMDDWSEWSALPVHAVSLRAQNGAITSSTRIITPTVDSRLHNNGPKETGALLYLKTYRGCAPNPPASWGVLPGLVAPGFGAQLVTIAGDIPTGITGGQATPLPVRYRRDILSGVGYVAVQTNLCPQAPSVVAEAYETIPLFYGEAHPSYHVLPTSNQPGDYVITFYPQSGPSVTWNPSMPSPALANITKVRIQRFAGVMDIEFDVPRRVSLSARYLVGIVASWNLRIALATPNSPLAAQDIRYLMRMY